MPALTLAKLKAHLNVTIDDDDDLIADKLSAAQAWVATYTASDVTLDSVPAPINEAILQLAAHLYENREASLVGVTAQALPFGMLDLLENYRAFCF
jgi:uncharacterized phage protein (predicted DNA packaging)